MSESNVVSPTADPKEDDDGNGMRPGENPVKEIRAKRLHGQEAFHRVFDFAQRASTLPSCPSFASGKSYGEFTQCKCLHQLRASEGAPPGQDSLLCRMVSSHVVQFGEMNDVERRRMEIEWIKSEQLYNLNPNDKSNPRRYFLRIRSTKFIPGENAEDLLPVEDWHRYMHAEDEARSPRVCVNALRLIYGLGDTRWKGSKKNALENTFPVHGLVGRKGKDSNRRNKDAQEAEEAVAVFWKQLAKSLQKYLPHAWFVV